MKVFKLLITVCVIVILTFIVFLPVMKGDFLRCWDDYIYVVNNSTIRDFSLQNLQKIFSEFILGNYHPLTIVSYAFEYHFFGLNPKIYHTTNLFFHIINCLLVFWLILILTDSIPVSFVTGILFAIHPLRVETVAWISDRKDLLSSFFLLWTLIIYIYYTKRKSIKYYIASLLLFPLSLLSKAMAITLPFLLILIDYFQHRKLTKKVLIEKVPFFAVALIFGVVAVFARGSYQGQLQESMFSVFQKISIEVQRLIFYYLLRVFTPIKLSFLKPFLFNKPIVKLISSISAFLILIIVSLLTIYSVKRTRKIVFGSLFFFITIFPVLTVVTLGYSADRFTYLSSIGIFYIFAESFFWLYNVRWKIRNVIRTFVLVFLAGLIIIFSYLSRQRCKIWKNCLNLAEYIINQYPNDSTTYLNRGLVYRYMGEYDKAIIDYSKALQMNSHYVDAYIKRGNSFTYKKEYDKAIADFTTAVNIDPLNAEGFYRRGNIYYDIGEYVNAISDFTKALNIDPAHAEVYYNRGNAYGRIGEHKKAISDYTKALRIDPNHIKAHYNRGAAYFFTKDYEKAIVDFTWILKVKPDNPKVLMNRAVAYFLNREYENAWEDVRKLEGLGYKMPSDFIEKLQKAGNIN